VVINNDTQKKYYVCMHKGCRRSIGEHDVYCFVHKSLYISDSSELETVSGDLGWNLPLFDYQKEDVDYLIEVLQEKRGAFNFNEMGTGKTIEALGVVERLGASTVLIICPNALRFEWQRQIRLFTQEDSAVTLTAANKKWDDWVGKRFNLKNMTRKEDAPRFYITNFETLRNQGYLGILNSLDADLVIMDEAHRIRTVDAKQAFGARGVKGKKFLLLTGTPIVNSAGDLFTGFSIVSPGKFSVYTQFLNEFTMGYGYSRFGVKNRSRLLGIIEEYGIQRKKKDVLKDLPDKLFRHIPLEMDNSQRKIYEQMENQLFVLLENGEELYATNVLAALIRLRQLCLEPAILDGMGNNIGSAKTDFLMDFIEDDLDQDEPLVIFTTFEKYVSFIEGSLRKFGKVGRITGLEKPEERRDVVSSFQNGDIRFCIGTVQAMGEGITLTRANKVFLMDRWWSNASNNQAIDRLHRIGQRDNVEVFIPTIADSIDDKLTEILGRKEQDARELEIRTAVVLERMREKGRKVIV